MNESEARRAALTAAVTWCGGAEDRTSTDVMLTYAAQFATWLLRPSTVKACSVCSHPEHDQSRCADPGCECLASRTVSSAPEPEPEHARAGACTCLHRSKHAVCPACQHTAHDAHACQGIVPATSTLDEHWCGDDSDHGVHEHGNGTMRCMGVKDTRYWPVPEHEASTLEEKWCAGWAISGAYPYAGCGHTRTEHGPLGCLALTDANEMLCPCERRNGE